MAVTTIKRSAALAGPAPSARAWTRCAPQLLAALTLPLMAQEAQAANWLIKPTLEVRESFSDNVRQTAQGKEGDIVTEYLPHVSVKAVGRRLRLNAEYTADAVFYMLNRDANNLQHQLYGDMTAELVDDLFFFDSRASVSQQNVSVFGTPIVDNINAGANRAEVRTLSLSPYLRHRFGRVATGELRFAHDIFNSSSQELANTTADRASVVLNSGSAFPFFGWGLQYTDQITHYANSGSTSSTSLNGNLRYALLPTLALTATGGHEKYSYGSTQAPSEGPLWTAGFSWRPSTRTTLNVSGGHRFYGKTYAVDANYRTRSSVWSVTYKENITTTQSQFQLDSAPNTANFLDGLWATSIPDVAARRDTVEAFIRDTGLPRTIAGPVNSFTNRFFLEKTLLASMAINGSKNTVVLSAFDTERRAQGGPNVNVLPTTGPRALIEADDSRQLGVNALWRWRLSSDTNANFSVGATRVSSDSLARLDTNKTARAALTRQFSRKLKGSVELRRLQTDSSIAANTTRENALAASMTVAF